MKKSIVAPVILTFSLILAAIWIPPLSATSKDGTHRVVIHVDDNDPKPSQIQYNFFSNI